MGDEIQAGAIIYTLPFYLDLATVFIIAVAVGGAIEWWVNRKNIILK